MNNKNINSFLKPTLIILAAGMGTRYGGLKQLDSFGPEGETILEYSVYDAIMAGFGKVLFVINAAMEEYFKNEFLLKFEGKIEADYVIQRVSDLPNAFLPTPERTKPWGTGQAVWATRNKVVNPFVVMNGDDLYGRDALEIMAAYLLNLEKNNSSIPEYCMLGYKLENTLSRNGAVSRGICNLTSDSYLLEVEERTHIETDKSGIFYITPGDQKIYLDGDQVVSMNIFGFTPEFFDFVEDYFLEFLKLNSTDLKKEFYLPGIVNKLVSEERVKVKVLPIDAPWFGVTYPDDKPEVVENISILVKTGKYPSPLWPS